MKIDLRPYDVSDEGFIFNSWLKSYRSSDFAKLQCNEVYYSNYKKIVESILGKSKIIVACNPDDAMQVYGYIIYEDLPKNNLLIHYVYVKYTYRKFGISNCMLTQIKKSNNPILISHYNKMVPVVAKEKFVVLYDPYRALI